MSYLKKHWGTIIGTAGPILAFLVPSLHAYAAEHPKTLVGVVVAALLFLYNSRAPKDKTPNA